MTTWLHSPLHRFNEEGTYMVTGSTLYKEHFFSNPVHLDYLQSLLLEMALKYHWNLEAWALFSNHYHFVAQSPQNPESLKKFITHFHASSARYLNIQQNMMGRKVWYQYWDSRITFQSSYFARLNYVMQNPVKHKLVDNARNYKWCSMSWFEAQANKSHFDTIMSFKADTISVTDDF